MGTKRDPTGDRRGILLPLPEIQAATITTSGNIQSGPVVGGAVPERSTRLTLETSGTLDGPLDQVRIATVHPGGVGTASVRWQYTGGGSLMSWDPPVMISGFEFIDRTTTANRHTRPHAIRVPSTGRVVVVDVYDLNTVQVRTQGGTGLWSSPITIEDTGDDTAACLCALASGRLLCFYIAATSAGASTSNIKLAVSDDDGATWTVNTAECLDTPLTKSADKYLRIRAASLNGSICLLLWEQDTTDTIYQYVSATEGASLTLVETFSTANKACPDLVSARGFLHVLTVEYEVRTGSDYIGRYRRLSSAGQPLSSATAVDTQAAVAGNTMEWGTYAGGLFTAAEAALLVDDDGDLWAYSCDAAAGHEVFIRHSTDDGTTWAQNGASSHTAKGTLPFWSGASTDRLKDLAVCPERGRAILFSRSAAGTATADDSLLATYLGGWSSVGMPQDTTSAKRAGVVGWDVPWLPIEKPQDLGAIWSANGLGGETLGSGGLTVTTTAQTRYYETAPTLTAPAADGILCEFHVSVGSGTWDHKIRITDGANGFEVNVRVAGTSVDLRDMNVGGASGTSLATAVTTASRVTCIRIALDKPSGAWASNVGRVRAWYRQENASLFGPMPVRDWTLIGSSTTLTSAASATARVQWGMVASGTGSATYVFAGYSPGLYTSGNIAGSSTGTTRGRVLPGASSPIHLTEGLRIHGVGGPTVSGDTWLHDVAYTYAIEHAANPWSYPSPRRSSRFTSASLTTDIVWTGLDLGWRTGDLLGIWITGANWPTATLYRDSGAANKVCDISLIAGTALGYTRSRGTIIPATGAALPFHAHEHTLRGGSVDLGGGVIRKIAGNQEGAWVNAAPGTYNSARVMLESYAGGDPSSGTLDLWMPSGLFLVETLQATDVLMLRIASATTADGDLRVGKIVIGRVRMFGQQYGRGRSQTWEINQEVTTTEPGGRYVRRRGPARRTMEIAWDDPIDMSGLHTSGTSPDWMTMGYTGADAVATPAATAHTVARELAEIGASCPIVVMPAVKKFSAATTTASPVTTYNPEAAFYGRVVTESLRVDSDATIAGQELNDPGEVVRGGRVVIEEEL